MNNWPWLDNYQFFVVFSVDRQLFLGFVITSDLRDSSPLTKLKRPDTSDERLNRRKSAVHIHVTHVTHIFIFIYSSRVYYELRT